MDANNNLEQPIQQADRIFQRADGLWYIRSRGNVSLGPYESRPDAQRQLSQQIRHWDPNPGHTDWSRFNPAKIFRRSVFRQT